MYHFVKNTEICIPELFEPKKNKTVAKKTAASTKKSVKAPKPTATDDVIKRYKRAKTPAVEQAATEVLSQMYSNQKKPSNRGILAKIKGCKPEEVLKEEIKQVNDIVSLRKKQIESEGTLLGTPFYSQPYNSYCMFMEKVPDKIMDLFQDINKLIGIKASRFSTIQDTEES
jgi:uncharacterized membrane-anchored protein YjiN (DUF445 family)